MKVEIHRAAAMLGAAAMALLLTGCTSINEPAAQPTAQPAVQATVQTVAEKPAVNLSEYQPSAYDYVMSYTENTRGVVFVDGDKVEQKFTAQDDLLDNVYFLCKPEEGAQGTPKVTLLDASGAQLAVVDLVHGAEDGTRVSFLQPVNKGEEYTLTVSFDGITGGGFVAYLNAVADTDGTCGVAKINGAEQPDVLFTQYVYKTKAQ